MHVCFRGGSGDGGGEGGAGENEKARGWGASLLPCMRRKAEGVRERLRGMTLSLLQVDAPLPLKYAIPSVETCHPFR